MVKLIPVIQGCSGYALIRIDVHQYPVWMTFDKAGVVILLKLVRRGLLYAVCGDANVNSNAPGLVILIYIDWLFACRNHEHFIRIDTFIISISDTLLLERFIV